MAKRKKTPTFLLELPLVVDAGQAKRLRAHLEAGRQFYNAVLCEGQRRLRQMRADPSWQAARALPRSQKQERRAAFSALREQYGFSDYALQAFAKEARVSWLAEHLEAVLAQTLASRATGRSIVFAWARPNACALRARAGDSIVSRTSATIPGCALCCRAQHRARSAFCSGTTIK